MSDTPFSNLNQFVRALQNKNQSQCIDLLNSGGIAGTLAWRATVKHQFTSNWVKTVIDNLEWRSKNGMSQSGRRAIARDLAKKPDLMEWWGQKYGGNFSDSILEKAAVGALKAWDKKKLPVSILTKMDPNHTPPRTLLRHLRSAFQKGQKEQAAKNLVQSNWSLEGMPSRRLLRAAFTRQNKKQFERNISLRSEQELNPVIASSILEIVNSPPLRYVKLACRAFDYNPTHALTRVL